MHNREIDAPAVGPVDPPDPATQYPARARTALAAAHQAELLVPGAVVGKVAYLDDGGSPIVLCARDLPFPTGRAGLRVALPHGGQLALIGRAAEVDFEVEEARRIGGLLMDHRGCLTGLLDREGALPVRFEIETVLVATRRPASRIQPLPAQTPEVIGLAAYAAADPDLFEELGSALAGHLSEDHQDLLLAVARCQSGRDDLLAVGAREVWAGGLTLDVVGLDGSSALPIRFAADLPHPHQMGSSLRTLAFERAS